jgi:hypothetical protein
VNGTVASLDVDPYSPEWLRNPYPFHEVLRDAGPVVRLAKYGVWALARYCPQDSLHRTHWQANGTPEQYIARLEHNPCAHSVLR